MTHETVELNYKGIILRGDLYTPENIDKQQAVLFFHGWTGKTNTHAAEFLAQNGYLAMTISMPGHNNSEGDIHTLTRAEALETGLLAYDYLAAKLQSAGNIVIVGNSFGGYIATLVAAERPVKGLSLRVPANYPDKGMDESQYGKGNEDSVVAQWRKQVQNPTATVSLKAINSFAGRLQLIEAEHDDRVPTQVIESYKNAFRNKDMLDYHFMSGWPHSLGGNPERNKEFQTILLSWLNAV